MDAVGRIALVVVIGLAALTVGYAVSRALGGPASEPVPVIDLDNLPPVEGPPATTTPVDVGAWVVPPPTVAPPRPVALTPPPSLEPSPSPPPSADDDDDGGEDDHSGDDDDDSGELDDG